VKAADWHQDERWSSASRREIGVSAPEELSRRSGLAFLRAIIGGELPQPPISRTLNFFILEAEKGRVVFQGAPQAQFYNPIGTIHGGWASTLLDSCMACAVHSTLKAGLGYTTIELKVNMVRAIWNETGPLRAEGWVVHQGRQVSTAEGKLIGADGRLYAHGSTTCLVFPVPVDGTTNREQSS
jgi:uncharacterized protein (TIGR00369 family)